MYKKPLFVIFVILLGLGIILSFFEYSTECQEAEIIGIAKFPICGKGPFMMLVGLVLLTIWMKYGNVSKKIQETPTKTVHTKQVSVISKQTLHMIDTEYASRFAIAQYENSRPKILSLDKVIEHPLFAGLSLKKEKSLIVPDLDKGKQIYDMWKYDKEKFKKYSIGDSYDTLLIFQKIFELS